MVVNFIHQKRLISLRGKSFVSLLSLTNVILQK
nr:MAG TPA: hypothetical protein [Caudoviricetes sp.]